MFRRAALAIAVAVAVTACAAPATPASLLTKVPSSGALRVCTTGDYRPFSYLDPATNAYTGIDIDMAKNLAAELGVEARFVPTTWATLMDTFTSGACDIAMGGISVTLARARKASFSAPVSVDGKAAIARCAEKAKFASLAAIDQAGVRVIVNPGGTNEAFAKTRLRNATLVPHPDNNTIFGEIVAARADVMITDASETEYQSKIHPELCPINPDTPFTFSEKAYLLPPGDEPFKQYVDQWVHLTAHNGVYAGFAQAWLN